LAISADVIKRRYRASGGDSRASLPLYGSV